MRHEKQTVQEFYDRFGWTRTETGAYRDTVSFVDTRPILDAYDRRAYARVARALPARGRWFLDAGSGALPHAEDLEHSAGFAHRVCVDLSIAGLREARAKLGARGRYVLADLTRLPFRDGAFDAIVSAHVLYHIPADEQATAVHELYRALARSAPCVIIYSRPDCPLAALARLRLRDVVARIPGARRLWRQMFRRRPHADGGAPRPSDVAGTPEIPPIYFHPHEYTWFRATLPRDWDIELRPWRSIDRSFTERFIGDNALGRGLLATIHRFETWFPRTFLRLGRYPMIVIRKP